MKKILMVLTLIFGVLSLTGCNKYTTYTELSYSQFQTKLDNKETFVIVMGSSTCSACAAYKQTMEKVIKDKQVEIFYLGIDKLSDEDNSKVYSKFVVNSTPTTIFIKDGVETTTYDRLIGARSYSEIVKNLEKHGYMGE